MKAFSMLPGIYSVLFLIRKSGKGLKPWWYRSNPLLFGKWLLNRNNELGGRLTLMLRMLN